MPQPVLQRLVCKKCQGELAWIQHGEPKEGRLALWNHAQTARVPLYVVTREAANGEVHEAEDMGTGEHLDRVRLEGRLQALERDHCS